jgi:putative FmdB family regulatory protein
MPIYEYRCAACGHHLEALQKMTEGPLRKCPDCGKSQLRRLVSASRFRLKGSGWYETDFKHQGEKKRNLVEKAGGESGESAAASEPATDTAAKAEATKAVTAEKGDGAAKSVKPKEASAKSPAPKRSKSAAKTRTTTKSARR